MIKYLAECSEVVFHPKFKFNHKQFWNIVLPLQHNEKSAVAFVQHKLSVMKYNAEQSKDNLYKHIFYYFYRELNDSPEALKREIQDWHDRQRCL